MDAANYYHRNQDKLELQIETPLLALATAVFAVSLAAAPFTASASLPIALAIELVIADIELGITIALFALRIADSYMSWGNDPTLIPYYFINIEAAKNELLNIDASTNINQLAIALGYDNASDLDLSNQDSLDEASTRLAEVENSTGVDLQGVLQEINYISEVSDNLTFIHRKKRAIIESNTRIFIGVKDMYRDMNYDNQTVVMLNYIFKKKIGEVLVTKGVQDIFNDGTFEKITDYIRCLFKTKGLFVDGNPECFSDPYIAMFMKFRQNPDFVPQTTFDNFITMLFGHNLKVSQTIYYKPIVIVVLFIFIIFTLSLFIYFYLKDDTPRDTFEQLREKLKNKYKLSHFDKFKSQLQSVTQAGSREEPPTPASGYAREEPV